MMSTLLCQIRNFDDFACMQPATAEQIAEAEDLLQLSFAEDYKDYLKAFGTASFDSRELTGICSSQRLSVISATIRQRENNPEIPSNWYVIEEVNVDGIVAWQDETSSVYLVSPDMKPIKTSDNLEDYLFH